MTPSNTRSYLLGTPVCACGQPTLGQAPPRVSGGGRGKPVTVQHIPRCRDCAQRERRAQIRARLARRQR